MFLAVAVIGIFPRKPCYDGATTFAEKTLGSGGRFWLVSHILSYQHTKTGGTDHTGSYFVRGERPGPSHSLESPF